MEEFTDLDDVSVTHCLKLWASSDDSALASLCRGLLFRRLYKTVDLTHLGTDAGKLAAILEAAKAAVAAAGGDQAYDLFYDEPEDTPYEAYSPSVVDSGPDEILVQDVKGNLTPFGAISTCMTAAPLPTISWSRARRPKSDLSGGLA